MNKLIWLPLVLFGSASLIFAACAGGDAGSSSSETGGSGGETQSAGSSGTGAFGAGGGHIVESTTGTGTGGSGGAGGDVGSGGGGEGGMGLPICADPGQPRTYFMSADDSGSMGSAAVAREYLRAGLAPPPALIRPYELLNYYRVYYPLPNDDKLGVHVHFAQGETGQYRFQVAVQAFTVERPPLALTLVLDTSGSLIGEGVARERAAVSAIAQQLVAGDRVSVVTWSNEESALLEGYEVKGPDDPTLLELAKSLSPGGGSDLHSGLSRGYELAEAMYSDLRLNRLVLVSDGGANLGVLDRDLIAQKAQYGDEKGIHLVGVGLGPAFGYSDTLMNAVTDAGRGSYVYLDSEEEANATLGDRFEEVMDIAARNVQIAVTLPSYFDIFTTSGEGVSLDQEAIEPQTIAPGDSMVLSQVLTLNQRIPPCETDPFKVQVTWNDPSLHQSEGENFSLWEGSIKSVTGEPWQLLKAEAIFAYGRALQTRKAIDLDKAKSLVQKAITHPDLQAEDLYAFELDEIADLLDSFPESDVAN